MPVGCSPEVVAVKHNYLNNVPLDEAVKEYMSALEAAGLANKTQVIPSAEAAGRITARAVYAKINSPHYNASAMDGIAVSAAVTSAATELNPLVLNREQFTPVDTGDPLPAGTDCVIMTEEVAEVPDGVLISAAAVPWQHVRQIGEDMCVGDMLMTSFTEITPALAGALLASGNPEVEVLRRPLAGIIPTGDEIVPADGKPAEGEIMEFNSVIFTGMLNEWGAESKTYPVVPDKLPLIERAIKTAAEECDMVLVIAGSSAGREDYTAAAVENTGTLVIHGLAIKPGKPAVLGHIGAVPCVGVPGYSVSAIIVMEKVVRVVADRLLCRQSKKNDNAPARYCGFDSEPLEAVLANKITSSLKHREFVRARLSFAGGRLTAVPLSRGAGVITSFTNAHAVIDVPQNREGYESGEKVPVTPLVDIKEVMEMLVVTGSHDPLIDEVADMLKRSGVSFSLSSSHVGSMGAITALKAGQAHLGGIHLLDEAGEYNLSYLKKHFPDGGIILIEGVGRAQGLMVAKGNPKGIKSFADIAKPGLSYVNRQRGSGTRILCDHFAKTAGINPHEVYGYYREEFTHTAVAALVKSGSADAGLGIYSAAKINGLDFIPIADEAYDFICRAEDIDDPRVRAFIKILQSEAFFERLSEMGGYSLKAPGSVKARL